MKFQCDFPLSTRREQERDGETREREARQSEDDMKCDTGHYSGLNEACLP